MIYCTDLPTLIHHTPQGHPENAQRVVAINQRFVAHGFTEISVTPAHIDQLKLAHDSSYVDHLIKLGEQADANGQLLNLDADTCINVNSINAARYSSGAAISCIAAIMDGVDQRAFCATRPPGHHAESNQAMGFCLFNHIAIAASYIHQQCPNARIAIVDFDVHHGNGTEEIIHTRHHHDNIKLFSSYQRQIFPSGTREGLNSHGMNLGLNSNCTGNQCRALFTEYFLPAIEEFKPDWLLISAGFDAHEADPLANCSLESEDFAWLGAMLKSIAEKHCNGKALAILEGGYDLTALADSVEAFTGHFA